MNEYDDMEISRLERKVARLTDALKPFAAVWSDNMGEGTGYRNGVQKEARVVNDFGTVIASLYPGNFRDAAACLNDL